MLLLFGLMLLVFGIFNRHAVSLLSPTLNTGDTDDVKVINTWFPKFAGTAGSNDPDIGAKSAILVNYDSGDILYAKNVKERLPAASTIKIMTALVALANADISKSFVVSQAAADIGEDTMGLSKGERVSLEELLYGLMLPSGNDAALTIAEGIAGSEDAFVASMNEMARSLGLEDTKFINASGLDVDGEGQYSTAFDLATLARFTWDKYEVFRRIVSTDHIFIPGTDDHKVFDLYNQTNLLTTYPGVRGIKPGFTWEAGLCLVTYAENNGVRLIGVILGSSDRRGEMVELLDYGFNEYGVKVDHPALDL